MVRRHDEIGDAGFAMIPPGPSFTGWTIVNGRRARDPFACADCLRTIWYYYPRYNRWEQAASG